MAGKILTAEDFEGGEPKPETSDKDKAIPADQKFDQEGKPISEEPVKEEPPEDKAKGGEEPQPKPSDDFKPKHKTWEETEKARAELEREFTRRATEAAELRRKLEQYERPKELPKPQTLDDRIAEVTDSALKDIKAIPIEYDDAGKARPESVEKYNRESAIIWGKATSKITKLQIEEANKAQETHRTTVSKLYDAATKEGLKSEVELDMVGSAFDRTDPNLDLGTRVANAVETAKSRIASLREGFVQSQDKDRQEKDQLKVLGRGSSRRGGKEREEEGPSTMSDQLGQLNESRRLKKDDLWR